MAARLFNWLLREFNTLSKETHVTPAKKEVGSGRKLLILQGFT